MTIDGLWGDGDCWPLRTAVVCGKDVGLTARVPGLLKCIAVFQELKQVLL